MTRASSARLVIPFSDISTTLLNFMNPAVLRGEKNRAVPPVGRTWLGPAR
jgi:hypothetical protein